jgi:hypothetical protein
VPVLGEIFAEYLARADIPSAGYEPWFVANGVQPQLARILAHIIVRSGKRRAKELKYLSPVVRAIKVLAAQRRIRQATLLRNVNLLLRACGECTIIETIFDQAGLDELDFIKSLEEVACGNQKAVGRLAEIAATIVPHLPQTRGVKTSAPSAAHEFFLEAAPAPQGSRAYTWNDDLEDFTDPQAKATCKEFGLPWFDPRPAYRKLKARKARKRSI